MFNYFVEKRENNCVMQNNVFFIFYLSVQFLFMYLITKNFKIKYCTFNKKCD